MSVPAHLASAYRQLRPAEKSYVDAYVSDVEREAQRRNERISNSLYAPPSQAVVAASGGLLERPLVRAAITERILQIAADSELTAARVVKEIAAISFASIGDYMTVGEDGQPYFDLGKATPEQLSAIKSIEIEETGNGMDRSSKRKFKFVLHDKIAALTSLVKYMGLDQADNPHWRAETARPVTPALSSMVDADQAQDAYAQMING